MQNLNETLAALGIKSDPKTYRLSSNMSCYLIELESANLLKQWDRLQKRVASFGWQPVIIGGKNALDEILQFTGPDSEWFLKEPPEPISEDSVTGSAEPAVTLTEGRATWAKFEEPISGKKEERTGDLTAEIDKLAKSPSEIRSFLSENKGKSQDGNDPISVLLGGLKGGLGSKMQELLSQTSDDDLSRIYQTTLNYMKGMVSFVAGMPESRAALQRLHDFENPNGEPETLEDAIRLSALLEPDEWFREKCKLESRFENIKLGTWPSDSYRPKLQFATDASEVSQKVAVAIIPARESWDVPCVVHYGGWNACPPAQIHTALLRRWNKLYGATLVSMTRDTIGLHLRKPVSTREEAVKVAREHYIFCNDLVDQGTGFLNDYASQILDASVWNFWWD